MGLNRHTPPLASENIPEAVPDLPRGPVANPRPPSRITRSGHGKDGESSSTRGLDATPPPDHEGFLEARALGLRAMREKLDRRRKTG